MSTSLVTLSVLAGAIGGVLAIALSDQDQPATLRLRSRRDRRRANAAATGVEEAATAGRSPARALRLADSPIIVGPMRLRDRLRSGLALTFVIGLAGAGVALLGAAVAIACVVALRRVLG